MLALERFKVAIVTLGLLFGTQESIYFGGHSDRVTPVPIPNTEVKPVSADGTWGESPWESRTSPDF